MKHNHSILSRSRHDNVLRPRKQINLTIPSDTVQLFREQNPKVCLSCYLESHILLDLRK